MPWSIPLTDQFQEFIDWLAVALKLTGSLALTVKFNVRSFVLLFPHEIRDGGEGGTDEGGIDGGESGGELDTVTVTVHGMVLLLPLLFVAFTFIVWVPETKLVVKLS